MTNLNPNMLGMFYQKICLVWYINKAYNICPPFYLVLFFSLFFFLIMLLFFSLFFLVEYFSFLLLAYYLSYLNTEKEKENQAQCTTICNQHMFSKDMFVKLFSCLLIYFWVKEKRF